MRLTVLGPPALVRADGAPAGLAPGKTFAVLVYLVHEASPPSRADLARVFWPDSEPSRARQSVRQTLSLIRKVLGEDGFVSDDPVKLRPGAVTSDVREFLEALREGEIERADALWHGPFAEGLALADAPEWTRWAEERQIALESRLCAGLIAAAEAARFRTDEGAEETTREAIELLRRAIEIDPYRERPRVVLGDLLVRRGRFDEALHEVAEARRALGEDTAELVAIEAQVESERRRRYASGEADPAPGLGGIFVGRTAEMGRLLGAWARAEEGVAVTAIVVGPAGIGKTRLARQLVEHVQRRGGIVAFASPLPAESEVEGAVIRDLAVQLGEGIARVRSRTGAGRSSPRRPPESAPPAGPGSGVHEIPGEVTAGADAFEALLRRLPAPALLVVDDVQWADAFSRAVLARVRRTFVSGPCMALATVRAEETDDALRETIGALRRETGPVTIELGPLAEDEVREILALATRIETLAADGAVDRVVSAARGSPLYVIELLRTLAETGLLVTDENGQLHPARPLPDPLPFPPGMRELIERRLEALPEDAIVVAAHLAAAGGRAGVDRLRDESGLATAPFSRSLGTLLERDVIRWAAPTELAFVHDEVRRTVARRFPLAAEEMARRARRRARRLGWAAMAVAAVPLLALGFARPWRTGPTGGAPAGPPWGGGRLVLVSDREITELQPTSAPPDAWPRTARPIPDVEVAEFAGPFLTTSGERLMFGRVLEENVPPRIVRIEPDGTLTGVARSEWDEGRPRLSPDGSRIAWGRGHFDGSRFDGSRFPHEVRVARSDGSDPRTIFQSEWKLGVQGWSRTGRFLLIGAVFPDADSLLAITPLGERRAGWAFEGEVDAAWCGQSDTFVVRGVRDGEPGLWIGDPTRADLQPLPTGEPLPYPIACSPDRSGVVYARAIDGRQRLVLLDVATGDFAPLPADADARGGLAWLPGSLAPIPVALRIATDSVTMDWGATLRLSATIERSDGAPGAEPIAWRSSDPAVVTVRPDGTVSGNMPGRTVVFASVEGGLRDTVSVAVRPTDRPDVLLQEDFSAAAPERWIVYGDPPAEAVRKGDITALALAGDGIAPNGVLSRAAFPIRGGATLEAEFRLPGSDLGPRRVQLCLVDARPDVSGRQAGRVVSDDVGAACFTYPPGDPEDLDPAEAELSAAGWRRTVRLSDDLPSDGWVRVSVQVRGDGLPFFFVNRRLVAAGPLRLGGLERPTWRVHISGASARTELLVRRLVVWRGARFVPLTWSLEPIDNISNAFAVWASSENDIWVSAGYRFLKHFDGSGWTAPELPPEVQNTGNVFGFGPGDVWMAGQHGIARYDGSAWRTVLDGVGEMSGIWGTGPDDVYVSGDGRFLHWNGRQWTEIPTGLSTEFNTDRLLAVWGSATDDVYLGGYDGQILHWDGARLAEVYRERGQNVHAIDGTGPDDVWAVGTKGRIWHFDGTAWTRVESGTELMLHDVAALSPREVYVTGDRGTLLRWDGEAWTPEASGTSRPLVGIFALSAARVYVAAPQGALLVGTR